MRISIRYRSVDGSRKLIRLKASKILDYLLTFSTRPGPPRPKIANCPLSGSIFLPPSASSVSSLPVAPLSQGLYYVLVK